MSPKDSMNRPTTIVWKKRKRKTSSQSEGISESPDGPRQIDSRATALAVTYCKVRSSENAQQWLQVAGALAAWTHALAGICYRAGQARPSKLTDS